MSFPDLAPRVAEVRERIAAAAAHGGHGQRVLVIPVTKTHGPAAVHAAWEAGLRDVGENRVQEALQKMEQVSVPVRWHLIGHLQRNKTKAAPRFALIQSLDSFRLADALHAVGRDAGRTLDVLVQVNASREDTKSGYHLEELPAEAERLTTLAGIRVTGVMTIAPFEADERVLRRVFGDAREARAVLANAGHPASELSMGMSDDFEVAVEEGATMVRLGTILFGARAA
jgi:pyridoxal phosphate enzyme (YggS family)